MKRSNLFLALTTGCLSVASFAFAKSHQKIADNAYCDLSDAKTGCTLQVLAALTITQKTNQVQATCVSAQFPFAHHLVYTTNCSTPLYTKFSD